MALDAAAEWVKRVLNVDVPTTGGDAAAGSDGVRQAIADWREALDRVDRQIAALQTALRSSPDPDLKDIAEIGLNAMTASHKIKIQAALMEIESGKAQMGTMRAAMSQAAALRAHVASDLRFAACDGNPFGVSMSLRDTLLPPLDGLQSALRQALGA
jgi:hypothetical protein